MSTKLLTGNRLVHFSGPYKCVVTIVVVSVVPVFCFSGKDRAQYCVNVSFSMIVESCCSLVLIHQVREQKGSITSSRATARISSAFLCAQFLAADAEASAIAALVKAERRARAPVQQQQAKPLAAAEAAGAAVHEVASGAVPVSEAGKSPAPPPIARDSEVAPTPQPAAWNAPIPTGDPSPVKYSHIVLRNIFMHQVHQHTAGSASRTWS